MFNCESCKETQPPRTKPHRVVVQAREQIYNNQGRISKGWEVVKEALLCDECYADCPFPQVNS